MIKLNEDIVVCMKKIVLVVMSVSNSEIYLSIDWGIKHYDLLLSSCAAKWFE